MSFDFSEWRRDQDPANMPFRPGAKHTQSVGLRVIDIGSPLHFGNDRGTGDRRILMPFAGEYTWELLDPPGVAGSILRLIPDDARGNVEIQVFHTVGITGYESKGTGRASRGEVIPVMAGDIGLSAGIHTHTELVVRYDDDLRDQLGLQGFLIASSTSTNHKFIMSHCARHMMNYREIVEKINKQIETWDIKELTTIYGVRRSLPLYRLPHWGAYSTLHIDTKWALQI